MLIYFITDKLLLLSLKPIMEFNIPYSIILINFQGKTSVRSKFSIINFGFKLLGTFSNF